MTIKTLRIHWSDSRCKPPQCDLLRDVSQNFETLPSQYAEYLNGTITREEAFIACLSLLRWVVARFIGKYAFLYAWEDDMASVGAVTILSDLDKRYPPNDFVSTLHGHLIREIGDFVSSARTATGTNARTQRRIQERCAKLPEATSYEGLVNEPWENMTGGEEELLDIVDMLPHICDTKLDLAILSPCNFGNEDLIKEFNVTARYIKRRRKILYSRLKEAMRNG